MLKTHVDILNDFNVEVAETLKKMATEHNFIIMEDRYVDGEWSYSDKSAIFSENLLTSATPSSFSTNSISRQDGRSL